jgi:hypothetical protein
MFSAVAAHHVPALASARSGFALLRAVALLVSVLALAPAATAADQPTPDPSLHVRPDPAPVQSKATPAKDQAAPVHENAAPAGRSPSASTGVTLASPNRTAQATAGQRSTMGSTRASSSPKRRPAAARPTGSHESAPRSNRAPAIAALRRLSPLLGAPRLLRPAVQSASSGRDSGAQLLLFAGLALLLLVAASASFLRLTIRLSGDVRREPGP